MNIDEIKKRLLHRYPFLLVDRVLEVETGKRILALKNVTANEPFFPGHFPQQPVMPGVLIVEALAQATGLLASETIAPEGLEDGALYYFVGIDKARFKRPVRPGDQLMLEAELIGRRQGIWRFSTRALVDGKLVASAEIMCTRRELSS